MLRQPLAVLFAAVLGAGLFASACQSEPPKQGEGEFQPEILPLPSDPKNYAPLEKYEAMKIPADNPITAEKAALGRQLFFDKRLSGDGALACYSCHVNEHGLTDGLALGKGAFGKPLTRSAPTLWNIGYHSEFYWDGRAKTLEAQVLAAWKGVNMGAAKPEEITAKLNGIKGYVAQFQKVFSENATPDNVAKALATYMRTIISRDTAWDRFQRGDASAVSDSAKNGFKAFEKAKCTNCHNGFLFTDQQYHNVGIGMSAEKPDLGRFANSKVDKDKGAFKTPTLRDVARSGPYFHNGSAATLEEAVKIMVGGGLDNPSLDKANLQKADLSADEVKDLVEFLKALSENTVLKEPRLPPEK